MKNTKIKTQARKGPKFHISCQSIPAARISAISWSSSRKVCMTRRCRSGSCAYIAMINSRRADSSPAMGLRVVIGTALPPSTTSTSRSPPSASPRERREKPSPVRTSEPTSRTGMTKRCKFVENAWDWPAASRPETVVSRCEARMLRSQRLTRQKPSNDVRRINQPEMIQ